MVNLKGDDLCGDGGADIGPQDNPNSLSQGHKARIDKADRHYGCCAAALDDGGDGKPDKDRYYPIVGEGLQDPPHPVSSGLLEPLGHEPHADEKKTYSPDKAKYQLLRFH